jgi:hypothetical protein
LGTEHFKLIASLFNITTTTHESYLNQIKAMIDLSKTVELVDSEFDGKEATPPVQPFYHRLDEDMQNSFWQKLWTFDNCASFHLYFMGYVAIGHMVNQDTTTFFMNATFSAACLAMSTFVVITKLASATQTFSNLLSRG